MCFYPTAGTPSAHTCGSRTVHPLLCSDRSASCESPSRHPRGTSDKRTLWSQWNYGLCHLSPQNWKGPSRGSANMRNSRCRVSHNRGTFTERRCIHPRSRTWECHEGGDARRRLFIYFLNVSKVGRLLYHTWAFMKHVYSKREDGTYVFSTAESYFAFEHCAMSLTENHLMSSTDPVKSFYVILH